MTFRRLMCAAIAGLALIALAPTASAEPEKVNALNFARAETDMYFARTVKQAGGLGKFYHLRVPTPIAEQRVVRMNRDTLYSSAVFDLSKDSGEKNNVAEQNPEVVKDLEARLVGYAKQAKPSQWLEAQPGFLGVQGETAFDPGYDIDDGGLPQEKPKLPAR